MKFKGFRASLNFSTGKNKGTDYDDFTKVVAVNGAYRVNRDEFFGSESYLEPPKKITPSMVKLPSAFQPDPTDNAIRAIKSTNDLTQSNDSTSLTPNVPVTLRKSTPNVSTDPRGGTTSIRDSTNITNLNTKDKKEQEKVSKKKIADQKKRDKLAAQEQAKQEKLIKEREKAEVLERAKAEKLRKEREKLEAKERAKQEKLRTQQAKVDARKQFKENKPNKDKSKTKPPRKVANPLAQTTAPVQPSAGTSYSTNTLESSISKTSGPPPYSETAKQNEAPDLVVNKSDDTGNTSFGKPIESNNTWDMIAQHKQQLNRKPIAGNKDKLVLNLQHTDQSNAITGRKSVYI